MENLLKLWEKIKHFPFWLRTCILILAGVLSALCVIFSCTACGTSTKVTIKNPAENSTPTVQVETNSTQDIDVNPNTNLSNSSNNGN